MIVRELLTRWGFDVDSKPLKRMERAVQSAKNTISALAVGTVAATGAVFGMAASTANAGDQIAKNARKLNINAQEYQKLKFAADQAGVSNEAFDTALKRFIGTIGEASTGTGDGAASFKALGIAVRGADGQIRPTEDLLGDFADRFAGLPDQTAKSALAMKLFGREGATMSLFLNEGRDGLKRMGDSAESLGNILSEDTLRAAEDLNDRIGEGKQILLGWKNLIGAELMPVVSRAITVFKIWTIQNRQLIRTGTKEFLKSLVTGIKILISAWKRWGEILGSGVDTLTKYKRLVLAVAALGWLMVAPWSALAAAIFLIADDIATYIRGDGRSVIGLLENMIEHQIMKIKLMILDFLEDMKTAVDEWWKDTLIYRTFAFFSNEPEWFKNMKGSVRDAFPDFAAKMKSIGDFKLFGPNYENKSGYGRGAGFAGAISSPSVTMNNVYQVNDEATARIVAKYTAEEISSIFGETSRKFQQRPDYTPEHNAEISAALAAP